MGIFDSTSTTVNNQFDNRAAADGGSIVATGNAQLEVTNISTSEEAFQLTGSVIDSAFAALGQANAQADDLARAALGQAGAAGESDIKEIVDKMGPLALIVFGVVAWRLVRK